MGCDIHMILQKKQRGKWVDKEILDINRDYSLFGVLAGVRASYEIPIDYPRGFPADFDVRARPEYPNTLYHPTPLKYETYDDSPGYYMGEHSFSWLTLEECQKYKHWDRLEWVQQEFKDLFFRCPNLQNWRICFGFDS